MFHRAFDCTFDQKKMMEQLITLGADRVLTSGGAPDAWTGRETLKRLQSEYGKEITILAGSGVNEKNVAELIESTGIHQVHSSCRSWLTDPTTSKGSVNFSYADEEHINRYEAVDPEKVRRLSARFHLTNI